MRSRYLLHVSLLLTACALAACGARTNVAATSNVTALYSHVWVTVQDVKVNTSASAAPGDSSWLDFPLATPQTFDLATVTNGGLATFGSALKIPTGTYLQMQLLLADSSAALVTSAQTASLLFNDQVEYLDSTGAAVAAPLQLVHPEQGIVLSVKLTIPTNTKAALAALRTTAATTAAASIRRPACRRRPPQRALPLQAALRPRPTPLRRRRSRRLPPTAARPQQPPFPLASTSMPSTTWCRLPIAASRASS